MVLLGVYLAQTLTVLAAAACLLLCLLDVIRRAGAGASPVVRPVAVRQPARRATRRQDAFDPTPFPSRGPPPFPPCAALPPADVDPIDAR